MDVSMKEIKRRYFSQSFLQNFERVPKKLNSKSVRMTYITYYKTNSAFVFKPEEENHFNLSNLVGVKLNYRKEIGKRKL